MAMNPQYKDLYKPQAEKEDYGPKYDFWKPKGVGDKVRGLITFVGAPYEAKSSKWKEGDPEWKKTFTSQKVNINAGGKDWSIGLSGAQFPALGEALAEHGFESPHDTNLTEGWGFGIELADIDLENNKRKWRIKLFPPAK